MDCHPCNIVNKIIRHLLIPDMNKATTHRMGEGFIKELASNWNNFLFSNLVIVHPINHE